MRRSAMLLALLLGLLLPVAALGADKMQNVFDHIYLNYSGARARVPFTLVNAGAEKFSISKDGNILAAGTLGVTGVTSVTTLKGANAETQANGTDDFWIWTGVGGSNNQNFKLDLDDATGPELTTSTGTAIKFGTAVQLNAGASITTLTGANGETFENSVADQWALTGVGGTAQNLIFDLNDATGPELSTSTGTAIKMLTAVQLNGGTTLPAGDISGADIADFTQTMALPIMEWRTGAAVPLALAAGTTPDLAASGSYWGPLWSTGENTQKIVYQTHVPADYASAMQFCYMAQLAIAAANNAETLSLSWISSKTGEANNPAANDECAAGCTITGLNEATRTTVCEDLNGGTIEAADSIQITLGMFAVDQDISITDAWLSYQAAQ